MPFRAPLSVVLALTVVGVAACGGGGGGSGTGAATRAAGTTPTAPQPRTTTAPDATQDPNSPRPASTADAKVVRGWADALRAGHIRQASAFFRLPVVVQNGGPAIRLDSREGVDLFNASLPCGARVVSVTRVAGYVNVAFRLVERAGANGACGSGAGRPAYAAFRLRGGRIVEWRRIEEITDVPPTDPGTPPSVPRANAPVV